MKTAIIYHQTDTNLQFFVVEGDYMHLDGCYLNSVHLDEQKEDEMLALLFEPVTWKLKETVTLAEFQAAVREGADIIVCGQLM